MMTRCDERGHIRYSTRLVERWNRREEWCTAFSGNLSEVTDITNNFCESAFRFVCYRDFCVSIVFYCNVIVL